MRANETSDHNLPQDPVNKDIDGWLSDEVRPWSHLNLSHELSDYDYGLTDDPVDLLEEFSQLNNALNDLLSPKATLRQWGKQYGELTAPTLQKHSVFAKGLARDCNKNLLMDSRTDVQALLGLVLAKANRLEESVMWLFVALTGFIMQFSKYSPLENEFLYDSIYALFQESIGRSAYNWVPLTDCMLQMIATLDKAKSDDDILSNCPQLFIHGFTLAHQCYLLGFIDSADLLYKYLIDESSIYFNSNHHELEKAIAHHRYGLLLIRTENWADSAKQLVLACEAVMKSASYDLRLVLPLAKSCYHLRSQLMTTSNDRKALTTTVKSMIEEMQNWNFTSEPGHVLLVDKYFDSNLPRYFAAFEPSAIFHEITQFSRPLRSTEPSRRERDVMSMVSMIDSIIGSSTGHVRGNTKGSSNEDMIESMIGSICLSSSGDESDPRGTTFPRQEELFGVYDHLLEDS